ncbi:MAG TPA: nuclear transport factor 2 family protein [Pseudonocardia sp.]|nr:nuclear transport factor 2 family protein [Pseudonocardia sp.]
MPSIEERVQVLEDREAIRELIAKYCRGVDGRNEDLFMSIWSDDASYRIGGPFGDHTGLEQIKGILHGLWSAFTEMHHWATNVVIEIDGDKARAWCNADVTGTDTKGRALMFAASYTDELRRIDGTWKFTVRDIDLHYMTPVLEPWSSDPASRFAEV